MPADIAPTHTLHFFNITTCAISHRLSPEKIREIWAEMSFDERSMLVSLYKKNPAPSNEVLAFFEGELHKILQGSDGSSYRRTAHSLLQDLDEMRGKKIKPPFDPKTFRPLKPPKKQFSG